MGHYLIKPKRDEDFYLMWSTIVDAPIQWGARADFVQRAIENGWIGEFERRFASVDEHGDDSFFSSHWYDKGPDRTITYQGFPPVPGIWEVKVEDLRALVESYGPDEDGDLVPTEASKAFLTPFDWGDD